MKMFSEECGELAVGMGRYLHKSQGKSKHCDGIFVDMIRICAHVETVVRPLKETYLEIMNLRTLLTFSVSTD